MLQKWLILEWNRPAIVSRGFGCMVLSSILVRTHVPKAMSISYHLTISMYLFFLVFFFFLFFSFLFFFIGFCSPTRLFHLFWAESIVRWGENARSPRKNTWPPSCRTWLVSRELGSNPQRWNDERFRAPLEEDNNTSCNRDNNRCNKTRQ